MPSLSLFLLQKVDDSAFGLRDIRLKDGAQGSDKDLRTGLKVTVQGDFDKSGEIVAHKIQVL